MKVILNSKLLPLTSVLGTTLPVPASADLLKDAAVGGY